VIYQKYDEGQLEQYKVKATSPQELQEQVRARVNSEENHLFIGE